MRRNRRMTQALLGQLKGQGQWCEGGHVHRVLWTVGYLRQYCAPYEKLKSVPDARQYLKVDIIVEHLDTLASRMSDTEAAVALNHARSTLFQSISAASRKQT
ncbi:MAG: hypothetical protein H7Y39_15900 [Nitrospiraceae bacterium]|nr:hypothetical protein [Nitrospiraceae bacterium]